jgi:nitroreductase
MKPAASPRRDFLKSGTALGLAIASQGISVRGAEEKKDQDPAILPFFEVIKTRRAVRNYKATPIPKKHVQMILEAARMTPSAGNQQPWKLLVVDDPAKILELREECIAMQLDQFKTQGNPTAEELEKFKEKVGKGADKYLTAPVQIIVLVDKKAPYPDYIIKDGSLIGGYILLVARALGYGTVFVTDAIPEAATRKVFSIPDHYERICIIPLGLPVEWPATPPKKALEQVVWFNQLPS